MIADQMESRAMVGRQPLFLLLLGIGLLFPLFFQLSGRIYNSLDPMVDSGGLILNLPLPISMLFGLLGGIWLARRYARIKLAVAYLLVMLCMMLLSLLLAGQTSGVGGRKLVAILQVMMPIAGLLLGQMVLRSEQSQIAKAFLYVLLFLVPIQLLVGWMQGRFALTHYLYVFSIYQHFQYVPLILVCAYAFVLVQLWDIERTKLLFLSPLMLIYAVASLSFLTIGALSAVAVCFVFTRAGGGKGVVWAVLVVLALAGGMKTYYYMMKERSGIGAGKEQYVGKFHTLATGQMPRNVDDRLADWKLFGNGILESVRTVVFGHAEPMPREQRSSAHNYYLDTAYTFGVLTLLPTLFLAGWTAYMLWKERRILQPDQIWLGAIVLYLVLVDSNFKVTLRQPYPGIFTYFMWGMLLSTLWSGRRLSK